MRYIHFLIASNKLFEKGYPFQVALYLTLLISVQSHSKASAQGLGNQPEKKMVFSTSVFEYAGMNYLGVSNFNLGMERYFGNKHAVYINAGYLKSVFEPANFFNEKSNSSGIALQLEGRYYFGKWKIIDPLVLVFWPHLFQYKTQELENSGYYFSLMAQYQHINSKEFLIVDQVSRQNLIQDNFGFSAKVGYQCIKTFGLVLDYSVGIGLKYKESNSDGTRDSRFLGQNYIESGLFPILHYQLRIGFGK